MLIITLKNLRFKSFIKFFALIFISLGISLALLFLLSKIVNLPIETQLPLEQLQNLQINTATLILTPFITGALGIIFALISYYPFKLLLSLLRGIRLEGKFNKI